MIDLSSLSAGTAGFSLEAAAPGPGNSQDSKTKKLADAAKQFEALMISQMMKSARESSGGGWLSDGDQTGEDTSMAMAEEQFAKSMAASGGLGLAKMIVKTMSPPDGRVESSHLVALTPKV